MNFFKILFLLFSFFIFLACEDLSFTDSDVFLPETKPVQEIPIPRIENGGTFNTTENSTEISEDETTLISENLELSKDTIIQNRKVILNMATIQTFEYDLIIIADEFVSNHSIIQNFPEGQRARERENGKSGDNVLITTKRVEGTLQLILNGEDAGSVPNRGISKAERARLSGANGTKGRDAIYREFCRSHTFIALTNTHCWDECIVEPTRGGNGSNGRQGFPGFNGRHGGDSGSFHLKAYDLSDFHLIDVKKTPGLGSEGGKGTLGGVGGKKGRNGRDPKKLCEYKPPSLRKGKKGARGQKGRDGQNGGERMVCLENLTESQGDQVTEVDDEVQKVTATQIICFEREKGVICGEEPFASERFLQSQLVEVFENGNQTKGKVICY